MTARARTLITALTLLSQAVLWPGGAAHARQPATAGSAGPLVIKEQGSFSVGGTVVTGPGSYDQAKPTAAGQTLHGDHAYVFYQIPERARKYPLILWHGNGQFSKTWETTPDGREGYQNIFLRRRFPIYVVDQPRRGRAGRATIASTLPAVPDDQQWYDTFRVGVWPNTFPGVQFKADPQTLDQYFRQMTPNTAPFDLNVVSASVVALLDKIGPAILVTHSQSGGPGWLTAIRSANVKGIVAYEPGSNFPFPPGEVPATMHSLAGPFPANEIPLAEFMKVTKIPIVIYYGDNIPDAPSPNRGQDLWRVRYAMAKLWRDAVNRHGGDVTIVRLPDIGIRGNTHFPFSDLNNQQIADLMSNFLKQKHLD